MMGRMAAAPWGSKAKAAIIERRLKSAASTRSSSTARAKGKPGHPITDFWDVWRNVLRNAGPMKPIHRSMIRTALSPAMTTTGARAWAGARAIAPALALVSVLLSALGGA